MNHPDLLSRLSMMYVLGSFSFVLVLTIIPQIQMYRSPLSKPWTSSSWAPEGYSSRKDAEMENKTKATVEEVDTGSYDASQTATDRGTAGEGLTNEKSV